MDRGDAIGAVAPQLCVSGRCVMDPDLHREGAAGEGEPAGEFFNRVVEPNFSAISCAFAGMTTAG